MSQPTLKPCPKSQLNEKPLKLKIIFISISKYRLFSLFPFVIVHVKFKALIFFNVEEHSFLS